MTETPPIPCSKRLSLGAWYWLLTAAAFAGGVAMVARYAPPVEKMGPTQKIFYLHMPVAVSMLAMALLVFIASIGYLKTRRLAWDDLGSAAARVAVVLGAVVLVTGSIWARKAWNTWWEWTPRLTFSLVLWLLYLVYVMIRPAVESTQRRAVVSAVYGIIAFLDVPLIWLSARLIPDPYHPGNIGVESKIIGSLLGFWFLPAVLMAVGLVVTQYRVNRATRLRAAGQGDAA